MNPETFRIFKRFSPAARKAVAESTWRDGDGRVTKGGGGTTIKGEPYSGGDWNVCPIARALVADGKRVTIGFPGSSTISALLRRESRFVTSGDDDDPEYLAWLDDQHKTRCEAEAFYSKWDAGYITADELYAALEALGFPAPEQSAAEFVDSLVGAERIVVVKENV